MLRKETRKLEGHHNSTDLCLLKTRRQSKTLAGKWDTLMLSERWIKVDLSREEQRHHFEFPVVVGVADNGAMTGQQGVTISAPKVALKTKRQSLGKLSSRIWGCPGTHHKTSSQKQTKQSKLQSLIILSNVKEIKQVELSDGMGGNIRRNK